jgi:3-dehydrosphinganine reductase
MGGLSIRFFGGQQWDVHGKHILITGGSQGLGLALAKLVASKGADVTICARSKDKLEKAVEQIKVCVDANARKPRGRRTDQLL